MTRPQRDGYTLIEVAVALFVWTVIGLAVVGTAFYIERVSAPAPAPDALLARIEALEKAAKVTSIRMALERAVAIGEPKTNCADNGGSWYRDPENPFGYCMLLDGWLVHQNGTARCAAFIDYEGVRYLVKYCMPQTKSHDYYTVFSEAPVPTPEPAK